MKKLISMYFSHFILNTINPRIRPRIDCCKTHSSVRSPLTPHSKQYTQFVGVQSSTRLFRLSTNAIRLMSNHVRMSLCWCSFSCHHFFSRVVDRTHFRDCSGFVFVLVPLQSAMPDLFGESVYLLRCQILRHVRAYLLTIRLFRECPTYNMSSHTCTWCVIGLSVMIFSMNSV